MSHFWEIYKTPLRAQNSVTDSNGCWNWRRDKQQCLCQSPKLQSSRHRGKMMLIENAVEVCRQSGSLDAKNLDPRLTPCGAPRSWFHRSPSRQGVDVVDVAASYYHGITVDGLPTVRSKVRKFRTEVHAATPSAGITGKHAICFMCAIHRVPYPGFFP